MNKKNIVFLKLQQWDFHKQHDKPTLSICMYVLVRNYHFFYSLIPFYKLEWTAAMELLYII
jgi:hypothetical protein